MHTSLIRKNYGESFLEWFPDPITCEIFEGRPIDGKSTAGNYGKMPLHSRRCVLSGRMYFFSCRTPQPVRLTYRRPDRQYQLQRKTTWPRLQPIPDVLVPVPLGQLGIWPSKTKEKFLQFPTPPSKNMNISAVYVKYISSRNQAIFQCHKCHKRSIHSQDWMSSIKIVKAATSKRRKLTQRIESKTIKPVGRVTKDSKVSMESTALPAAFMRAWRLRSTAPVRSKKVSSSLE